MKIKEGTMLRWLLFFESFFVAQAVLAYDMGMCTGAQLLERNLSGLPFIYQGSMWGDLLFLSPLLAWVVSKFSKQWMRKQMAIAFAFGLLISTVLHVVYCLDGGGSAHVLRSHLTASGWVHVVYMALGIAVLCLYFMCTYTTRKQNMVMYGVLVVFQVMNYFDPAWHFGHYFLYRGNSAQILLTVAIFPMAAAFKQIWRTL